MERRRKTFWVALFSVAVTAALLGDTKEIPVNIRISSSNGKIGYFLNDSPLVLEPPDRVKDLIKRYPDMPYHIYLDKDLPLSEVAHVYLRLKENGATSIALIIPNPALKGHLIEAVLKDSHLILLEGEK
jgi:biopolymer transport protein ExbD